ncbi:zinc finger protein 436 [Stomoxys calcitrans]|uniref:zinc finger protein 436 n=1 Tax=Stomoxys calcitrans TaxID=35570 RepID=UPI0027E224CD|nr:zinc finger protein 436 [Stomoxys calcitrans]
MAENENFDYIEDGEWYAYEYEEPYGSVTGNVDTLQPSQTITDQNLHIEHNIIKYETEHIKEGQRDCITDELNVEINGNDFSKHNLVLKECITELGLIKQSYFCQECSMEYNDINEFLLEHPGIELLSENPENDVQDFPGEDIVEEALHEKVEHADILWDLVENVVEGEKAIEPASEVIEYEGPKSPLRKEGADTDKEQYFCYECQGIFNDLQTAEDHECGTLGIPVADLEEPPKEENDVNAYICTYCNLMCISYEELSMHMTNCDEEETVPLTTTPATFSCNLCKKVFHNQRTYNNHMRFHRNKQLEIAEGPVKCDICNTFFETAKNLKLHMKMHNERSLKSIQEALPAGALPEYNELNQFFCEICNKSFDQKLLIIHKNMHQNVEEYNCSKCNKQFDNATNYEMHIQMHNETKGNKSKQTVVRNQDLFGNGQAHKKHACQYCGKEFLRPYEKVKHERIHTGEKPFNCEVCGKTFRVSYSLTLHLRTHTDIRPYVCATCNKRFKQQSVYAHHLKTHLAERQYKCEECGKSFRTSVQLCGHRNSHKRPYSCTECNRSFVSMYAVKMHMKTHKKGDKGMKILKNRCHLCGATYAHLFALRLHLKEKHGVDMEPQQLLEQQKALSNDTACDNGEDFINEDDDNFVGDDELDNNNDGNKLNGIDHDDDMDETMAATQTILPREETTIDDNLHAEEIITDWLK